MNLRQDVKRYVGGQMETQNLSERYIYRGEIAAISIENDELKVRFAWLAKGEGYPPIPKRWVKDTDPAHIDYSASLVAYAPCKVGEGRLAWHSAIIGETVVLFPPDGSRLDPSKVEGLEGKVITHT